MSEAGATPSVGVWDPRKYLRPVNAHAVKFSRGFFRSHPDKWFPGLTTQWLPLWYSLGIEVKGTETKPAIELPNDFDIHYTGSIEGESFMIGMDRNSADVFLRGVLPGALERAESIVLEYFARRFMRTLESAWSGPQASQIFFDPHSNSSEISIAGGIRNVFTVNGKPCEFWVGLGERTVATLDGLWRRQLHSSTRFQGIPSGVVHVEIAQLAVAPSLLVDYTKSGTVIDLEVRTTDAVTLRLNSKPWLPARLCEVSGNFAVEVVSGPPANPLLPEGTTRLAIVVGLFDCDAPLAVELTQPGASVDIELPVSDQVTLVINGERVATATLKTYEGRLAMVVN